MRDLDVASGGPSRSVPALAESQSRLPGIKVSVFYQDTGNSVVSLPASEVDFRPLAGSIPWFGNMMNSQFDSNGVVAKDCIFHLHGLWTPLLHKAAAYARMRHLPYVISTRGMLAQWALEHKAFKKRLAWWLYQEKDLSCADYILTSGEFERRDVSAVLPGSKIVVIPNGCGERPNEVTCFNPLPGDTDTRWVLAMGRLHPVKGFAELIEAWSGLGLSGWRLAIAGPDEGGYRARLEELIRKHGLMDRVLLLGEVSDAEKWTLLEQCELFVAPSKTENFGMAIAEALQSGTPVITTTGTPWRELNEYDCGWWIGPGTEELRRVLKVATEQDAQVLGRKGAKGQKLIREKYSWNQAAARTIALYQSILCRDSLQ